jgi:hypothetical protein
VKAKNAADLVRIVLSEPSTVVIPAA